MTDEKNDDGIIVASRQVWYEADPASPKLEQPGLDFVVRSEAGTQGLTPVVLATWNLPGADAVTSGVRIVAIDAATGAVFQRNAERRPSGNMGPRGPKGHFNVDLVKHLDIPFAPRTYWVFLWFAGKCSPVRSVEVPALEPEPPAFTFAPVPDSKARPEPKLSTELVSHPKKGKGLEGVKVRGTATLAATRVFGQGPLPLVGLAATKSSPSGEDRVASLSQALPDPLGQQSSLVFEVEPLALFDEEPPVKGRVELVFVVRGVRSDPLVLELS